MLAHKITHGRSLVVYNAMIFHRRFLTLLCQDSELRCLMGEDDRHMRTLQLWWLTLSSEPEAVEEAAMMRLPPVIVIDLEVLWLLRALR